MFSSGGIAIVMTATATDVIQTSLSAIARMCVVSVSPILSERVRITDQTASSGFFGSSGR